MRKASILQDIIYKDNKPNVSVLLQSDFTKEIRISFIEGQVMKEHKTPFPIVVAIVEGCIDFGVDGEVHRLEKGDIVSLEGDVPHDLKAIQQSIVRLTLSTSDSSKRVKEVAG